MSRRIFSLLALGVTLAAVGAAAAAEPVKAVYHLNLGIEQASRALNNVKNHLDADPTARIVVVTHGAGIDFLLKDAKAPNGAPFSNAIDELSTHGVEFRVCKNTLETRKIDPARVVPEGKIVASGVAEIARLQAREGYVYVKP